MEVTISSAFLTTLLLVSLRLTGIFLFTPLFLSVNVPVQVRGAFVVALSFFLAINLPVVHTVENIHSLLAASVSELLLGVVLAFGISAVFALFSFGGRLLDVQMGFGVANLIDPSTNTQAPLLGTFLQMMAVFAFFLVNGHHMLIRGLFYSFNSIPPGEAGMAVDITQIVAQFGLMFSYGLVVVAPVVVTLLLLDIGFAVVSRTMPQVNMFIVGMPIKVFAGILVLAISLNYLGPFLGKAFSAIFVYWDEVIQP